MRRLIAGGAHIHIPRADQDYAVEVGLRMLPLRHLVEEENGLYRANPREEILLRYYANSIAHLLSRTRPRPAAGGRLKTTRGHECSPKPTAARPPTR